MADGTKNLTPFTPGDERAKEAGAKGGSAKKGSRHLANLIREIGMNIDWDKTNLKDKENLKKLYGKNGWQALIYVAMTKAISGDTKAMDWLSKNGFGTKIDLTTDDEPINEIRVTFVGEDEEDDDGNPKESN
jgi:hypothetical protein